MAGEILFYHTHKQDTGHTMHLARIISALNGRGVRPVVFQGGEPQPYFEGLADAQWLHLPDPFYSRRGFDRQDEASGVSSRADFMLRHIERLKPSVFVTSFFPLGRLACRMELRPVLARLKAMGTRLVCSSALPYFSHPEPMLGLLASYVKLYDEFLIHCPRELDPHYMAEAIEAEGRISRARFERAMESVFAKTVFTGYVMGPNAPRAGYDPRGPVLVHRGGGAVSLEVLVNAILAKRFVPGRDFVVSAGYAATEGEVSALRGLIKAHRISGVTLGRFVPDLFSAMTSVSAVVGTAGGTVYEQLYHGVPSVLVPFEGSTLLPRADQLARAALLHDRCGAAVVRLGELGPLRLAGAINEQLALPPREAWGRLMPAWFDGAAVTAERLIATRILQ